MKYFYIVILAIAINACSVGAVSDEIEGKVVSVADGDTITVLGPNNNQHKIRLAGIDCPERKQAWGNKARQAVSDLVFGEHVSVFTQSKDRYDRLIGVVYVNGTNVNQELVKYGNCWVYERYAKDKKLFSYHDDAKKHKVGLWSMPEDQIVAPWDFRSNK